MFPSRKQWQSWSLPSKLTLIGTYSGVIGLILSIVFFFFSLQQNNTETNRINSLSRESSTHLTGLLDNDEYLDEALFVYPNHSSKEPGLYLRLSNDQDSSLVNQIPNPESIGMSWSEEISMYFDNKNSALVLKSYKEESNILKEKIVTIKIMKNYTLPALATYKMKINHKVICDIDYFDGSGVKDGVIFKGSKETPLFVWDESNIPVDCR